MKTSMIAKSAALIALLGAVIATPLLAQPGPGMGAGAGMQNGGPGAGQMGMGHGMGHGMGGGKGGGMLLSPEERADFRAEMQAVKTYEECTKVQADHREYVQALAKEKGITLPEPRRNRCDNMKARGFFK
jgi:hypothetical protein